MNLGEISVIKKYSIVVILVILFGKAEWTIAQGFRSSGRTNNMDTRSNFSSTNIDNSAGMHKIESIKTDYLSENMHLTSDEASKFWPLYSQYQQELTTVLHQKRQNMLNTQKNPQDIVDDNLDFDSKILSIKKHYKDEFSKVLPSDKLANLYKSERQFNEEMIKRLKHGRENNGN